MHRLSILFNSISLFIKKFSLRYLSFRGIILLCLGIFTLGAIAEPESDLLLWMMGGAAVFLPLLAALFCSVQSHNTRRDLVVRANTDSTHAVSKIGVKSGLRLHGANLFPFLELEIRSVFVHSGVISATHIVKGTERRGEVRFLFDELIFPHRGIWRLKEVEIRLRDILGLANFFLNYPLEEEVEVFAPVESIRPLPVVASSSRAGDIMESNRERTGDPFDIKTYDPSDGISRILWKTFAKSGELVVRRPEPSVIPEGEVAVYLVAGVDDDHVAGAFASYLKALERGNITALFGTDGNAHPVSTGEREIMRSIHEAVWSDKAGTGSDFGEFLDRLISTGRVLTQVLVFGTNRFGSWVDEVELAARKRNVSLTIAIVPMSFRLEQDLPEDTLFSKLNKLSSKLITKLIRPMRISQTNFKQRSGPFRLPSTAEVIFCQRNEYLHQ